MEKGIIFGDTIIEGILFTLKDGSTKYVRCKEPIIYKTAEKKKKQNFKNSLKNFMKYGNNSNRR